MKDLSNYRRSYEKSQLTESNIPEDPVTLFRDWFIQLEEMDGTAEVNAMTVSTIGVDGYPKSRVVLLKQFTHEGFVFYTNYNSEKGRAIEANPNVCLSFFWHEMERQVIIKGKADKAGAETSDEYFQSRPHGSRLGALVSPQSEVIPSREYLEENLKHLEASLEGKDVNRPGHWGGYIVRPVEVEFWQGRANRLHDRIRYKLQADLSWTRERLAP